MSEHSYLELLDLTGRQLRSDKPGAIPSTIAPILEQLDINTDLWVKTVDRYGSLFFRIAGRVENMVSTARKAGLRWLRGVGSSREVFVPLPQPT